MLGVRGDAGINSTAWLNTMLGKFWIWISNVRAISRLLAEQTPFFIYSFIHSFIFRMLLRWAKQVTSAWVISDWMTLTAQVNYKSSNLPYDSYHQKKTQRKQKTRSVKEQREWEILYFAFTFFLPFKLYFLEIQISNYPSDWENFRLISCLVLDTE